jgi:hypothetical protein
LPSASENAWSSRRGSSPARWDVTSVTASPTTAMAEPRPLVAMSPAHGWAHAMEPSRFISASHQRAAWSGPGTKKRTMARCSSIATSSPSWPSVVGAPGGSAALGAGGSGGTAGQRGGPHERPRGHLGRDLGRRLRREWWRPRRRLRSAPVGEQGERQHGRAARRAEAVARRRWSPRCVVVHPADDDRFLRHGDPDLSRGRRRPAARAGGTRRRRPRPEARPAARTGAARSAPRAAR